MAELPQPEDLPAHIEDTIAEIARLHADHRVGATREERAVEDVTRLFGTPRAAGLLLALVLVWIGSNIALMLARRAAFDPPPFGGLQTLMAAGALFMTIFILVTQRRENALDELRAQLILEHAMLAEQKTAKAIQLLEELRADLPLVRNRHDPEATELAKRAEPGAVLDALKDNQRDLGPRDLGPRDLGPRDPGPRDPGPRDPGQAG